ncbi:bacteriohemerythrin [Pseudodesulfovibrio sp.]|uniref:bacteriohemerythrin n=1 Tax=Pseudodesulfovibrio sp. TaxID=2035812 RepID=UPI00260FE4B5|nr:bacteriohemerythrin [Pseudodesulfovibrio sp.]MDD3311480.1 bacteriohemerythrin [Pseudodesulfovibrio sp.]
MPLITWDEIMSVGVEELDDQHRRLIDLINDAYEALQSHDEHRMVELVEKMQQYARTHFETEENYMRRDGFPGLSRHKGLHETFNRSVAQFRAEQYGGMNLSKIFVFLSRWLATHILEADKEYVPYLAAGKKPA